MVRIREPEDFGGIFDVRVAEFIDESVNPVVWMLSAEQRQYVLGDGDTALQTLLEGGEGAGKTTGVLARWMLYHAVEQLGQGLEWGLVAPIARRLERARQAMVEAMPREWYAWRQRDGLFTFANGAHHIRLLSAHQQSEVEGSPIQSFDWAGAGGDESQDMIGIIEDMRARGRRAPGGRYPMMLTATMKSTPDYRTFRDRWKATPNCGVGRLAAYANPYVAPKFWEERKQQLSAREYARRIDVIDVGPERSTYPSWVRADNLQPLPELGVEDVTAEILKPWGQRLTMLGGHDPGKLWDVTLMLKAFRIGRSPFHVWWVVDELTTEETTTEQHADALVDRLRTKWGLNDLDRKGNPSETGGRILIRADPYSNTGNDERSPDKSVYTTLRSRGLSVLPGATTPRIDKVTIARVPKEAGIEMVNRLCCSAAKVRRLFVDCDDRREPAAPRLVNALERSDRDTDGKAETQKKNVHDLSHWPAALRYALWMLEKPRMERAA